MITRTTQRFFMFFGGIVIGMYKNKTTRRWIVLPLILLLLGFLLPQKIIIPVEHASTDNWDINSFWAYPWGSSITHKGIDIFQDKGKDVYSSTYGLVVYTHEGGKGGKSVMILGPKWRFHYYAHLDDIMAFALKPVAPGSVIGTVGDSGNAKGKPPHLHYEITTPFPYFWLYDKEAIQGWKKMFFLKPDDYLRS